MSIDTAKKWGRLMRKIHSITGEYVIKLGEHGELIKLEWKTFLSSYIKQAIDFQDDMKENLVKDNIDTIINKLNRLYSYSPAQFSFIHGDLHCENIYLVDGQIRVLDNEVEYLYLPALYDLVIIFMEVFPSGTIIPNDEKHKHEKEYLEAFLDGYGSLSEYDMSFLNEFILLRSLFRYPNPFFKRMKKVVQGAML